METGNGGASNKSNSNEAQSSDVDVENHPLKSTATIITQNTSSQQLDQSPPKNVQQTTTSSESFLRNEQQQAQVPPQPAPRTRLSSQNSIPMTNGDAVKADDAAQVRKRFYFHYVVIGFWVLGRLETLELVVWRLKCKQKKAVDRFAFLLNC